MFGAPSYEILVAGRLLYGLGIGFAMHAAPAYIAEVVSPPPPPPGARVRAQGGCLRQPWTLTGF